MNHTILIHHLKHGTTYLIGEGLEASQGYNPPNRYMLEAARVLEQQGNTITMQAQHLQELQHNYQAAVDHINKLTKVIQDATAITEQNIQKESGSTGSGGQENSSPQ